MVMKNYKTCNGLKISTSILKDLISEKNGLYWFWPTVGKDTRSDIKRDLEEMLNDEDKNRIDAANLMLDTIHQVEVYRSRPS